MYTSVIASNAAIRESYYTDEDILGSTVSYVTHINESCHTSSMSHVTYMNESCHPLAMRVMSHT